MSKTNIGIAKLMSDRYFHVAFVCVCVCVRERERERERVCVCVCVRRVHSSAFHSVVFSVLLFIQKSSKKSFHLEMLVFA